MEDGNCAFGEFVNPDPGLDAMMAVSIGGDLQDRPL